MAKTPEGEIRAPEALPKPTGSEEYCEFRDMPPAGLTRSLTTESWIDEEGTIVFEGGPTLADDPGDFVLCIEVPDDFAFEREAHYEPPYGWPFREFWPTVEEAKHYRHTLRAFDSNDGEEVPLELVGK